LSPDEAFAILRERRGTIHDPLVVDAFVQAYPEIVVAVTGDAAGSSENVPALTRSESDADRVASFRQFRTNASENALLIANREKVATASSLEDAVNISAQCLRQLTPAIVCALYVYDSATDSLICKYSSGDSNHLLSGFSIRMGERVTGWSAATRKPSVNSDASLDLANLSEFFEPPLRSVLCTPLTHKNQVLGVLTAYSNKIEAFGEAHSYAFEQIGLSLLDRLQVGSVVDTGRTLAFHARNA
jgi:putative methionine-R-sulfoxide reductase with GAF domain